MCYTEPQVIVLVYGYDGSGTGHWQRLLARELAARGVAHAFPELPDPQAPRKDDWVSALARCLDQSRDGPVTLVCHSLGCWAVDHLLAERRPRQVRAVLLVAPPSPVALELFEPVQTFLPPPMSRDAWAPVASRSLLVGSDSDDYASSDEHAAIAERLGIEHRLVPGAGHINVDSGFGPWPLPLEWLSSVGSLPD